MNRFTKLIQMIKRQCSWSASSRRSSTSRYERRRLFLEPLQPREVLAVAIDAFTPTSSGFVAELSAEIRQSQLNLYDTQSQALGAADVTLTGTTTGNVRGSLVVEGTRLTFIATGGALPTDTYTATLRSASNAIVDDALGELLDGEFNGTFPSGNGVPGGDFNFTFSVNANPLVVSIPDFARGPEQSVLVPATGSGVALPAGLPIRLSDANGVSSLTMRITYNPDLLTITGAERGPDAPQGSQVQANVTVPGEITVAFFALDPMSSGAADIIHLTASVPESATYGATQIIDIAFLEVNAGAIQATADDALHVVAYPGDANANRRYDAEDARLIARAGLGLDSGFVTPTPTTTATTNLLYPIVDAVIIGDVTGVDGLSPLDASDVLRVVVGLPTPNIPAIPTPHAPTAISLSAATIAENQPVGTLVGTFTSTDPDAGDTHTYTLVSGVGATNNALFTINGATLRTAAAFDSATPRTLNIRVRTTDSTNRSFERTFSITVTGVNSAPTAIAISNNSVAENSPLATSVGTLTSTDPDANNTHTYTLVSGTGATDNASFSIVGNQLQVATALDFETKASYSVRIRSTDQGGLFFEQTFTINVSNVNDAPTSIVLSSGNVAEGEPVGTVVGTLTTDDQDSGDTHGYSLVAGAGAEDNASFSISGNQLLTAEVFARAVKDTYNIRLRSTDSGGLSVERTLTISISETNSAPTALALSGMAVDENAQAGTAVGTFTTTDPNTTDTHTYTLVSGLGAADNASFTIVGDQLRTVDVFDFETRSTYSIRVRSTDSGGLSVEEAFTITINNVNEAPTALLADSNDALAEDAVIGTVVATLTTSDPDVGDTHTYSLVTGVGDADNAKFMIVGDELQVAAQLDFDTQATYSVRVQSTDQGGLSVSDVLTITITGVNEAPTAIAISHTTVAEGEPIGTLVGVLTSTDPDAGDTHTYAFATGSGDDDNASFTIVGNQLLTAEVFNQVAKGSYSIRVESTDAGGLTFEQVLVITIAEANVAPTAVALNPTTIDENVAVDTVVGTFTTTDANATDTHAYTLVAGSGGTDNAAFAIDGNQLKTAAAFDFETQSTYSIRVRSTDRFGLSVEEVLTITVNDLNEAPTAIALNSATVAEDAPIGTAIGTLSSTDQDVSNTHTYSLVTGEGDTDNVAFEIVGGTLQTLVALDFETQPAYSIRVQSTDQGGLAFEQVLTITVTNVNEEPTSITIDRATVAEAEPVDTLVGLLATNDPDAGDTHTYTSATGPGDDDNASFTISGTELRTNEVFDETTKDTYSIRIQSTDAGGLSVESVLIITITESNAAPTALALDNSSVDENVVVGTLVGTFSTTDANTTDTFTYTLVSGAGDTDNESFTISGDQLLTAASVDFETQATYSIRVQSTDPFGLSVVQILTIAVIDLNEAPTQLTLNNDTISEDATVGATVGTLSTTDVDAADTHTYLLVVGEGDDDNASFTIDGNELKTAVALDFETQASYSIRVQSTDSGGLTVERMLVITVANVNEAPTAVALSNSTVEESQVIGTVVGMLLSTDQDTGDTHTYSFVTGSGDTDNDSFTIVGDELQTAEVFVQATKDSYSIRVESTDAGGLTVQQVLTITITEINVSPTALALTPTTVDENVAVGTAVGTFSTTDANAADTHTYTLVAGAGATDNDSFTISGDQLLTAASLDFETQPTYSIRVQSTDPFGLSVEEVLTITVNDLNEAPTAVALDNNTVAEDAASDSSVGTLTTTDPDSGNTHTYSLVTGEGDSDNASFTIVGNELRTAATFDFETKTTYSIRVQSMDQGGLTVEQMLTVTVTNVNEEPTAIALDNAAVSEGESVGTVVGTLTSSDPDSGDTHTYSLAGGNGDADNASFTINGDQLLTAEVFVHATKSSYSVRVRSTDQGGLTVEQVLTITVNDVNDAPTAIAIDNDTLPEDAAIGTTVGMLTTTDPDTGNTHTYTLVTGDGATDNDSFTIVGDQLRTSVALDFETKQSYSLRVRSTDEGGEFFERIFTILVTDVAD